MREDDGAYISLLRPCSNDFIREMLFDYRLRRYIRQLEWRDSNTSA